MGMVKTSGGFSAGALAVLLLAGCSGVDIRDMTPEPGDTTAPLVAEHGADPAELVGRWRVRDARGAGRNTWLRLVAGAWTVEGSCGLVSGGWAASPWSFIAAPPSVADGRCGLDGPEWLMSAASHRPSDDGWELLGQDGTVVARLLGEDPASEDSRDAWVRPRSADRLGEPAALPNGLRPATGEELRGTWTVPGRPLARRPESAGSERRFDGPHLTFEADGTWTGSDGCNGSFGSWAVEDGGWAVVASQLASTLAWCDGVALPRLLDAAGRLGIDPAVDPATLVLVDRDGDELIRLIRE